MVFKSVEAFMDIAGQYKDAGINELIWSYPSRTDSLPGFERMTSEVIPKLRG